MDDIRQYIMQESLKPKKIKFDRLQRRKHHMEYKRKRVALLKKLRMWRKSPTGRKKLKKMKIKMHRPGYRGRTYY